MSQLAWPHILSVALRINVCEALLRSGHTLDIYMSDEHSAALLHQFEAIAQGELLIAGRTHRTIDDVTQEGPAIDAYLKRVRDKLEQHAQRLAEKSAHAKQLFDAMMAACGSAICHACCGVHACPWTVHTGADDAKRMASGDCMQPVRHLFDWICNAVASRHALAGVRHKVKYPQLLTGHGSRNGELALAINASTHRGTARGPREIRMSLHPETLWVEDYLSLAYVFVHECTAHAWCGVDIGAADAEASKLFHEGWMDEAAAAVLCDALKDQALTPPAYAKEIWSQTKEVRGVRFRASRASASVDVWQWKIGVRAFDILHTLFAHTLEDDLEEDEDQWDRASSDSRKAVVDLSLKINASTISHRERTQFVWTLLQHFTRSSPGAYVKALARNSQVIDLIREYQQIQDEKKFVRRILTALPCH